MKDISFVVPCYNSEGYMKKCIDSLLIGKEDVYKRQAQVSFFNDYISKVPNWQFIGSYIDEGMVSAPNKPPRKGVICRNRIIIIIPISKVSYGFASGGSDLPSKAQPPKDLFGGGAGAGVTIVPIGFLTISQGNIKMLQIDPFNSSADRVVAMVPDIVEKISDFVDKRKEEKAKDSIK